VIASDRRPEPVMNDLKVYASRALNKLALDHSHRYRWARHGSTRYLWTPESIAAAVSYVVEQQGKPLAVYVGPGPRCTTAERP
jgi:hypothetical protein